MVVDDLSIKNINHAHQETKTVFSNYINVFDMYFPELIRSGYLMISHNPPRIL